MGSATTPGVSIIRALCSARPAICCESALPCLDPHHPSGEKAKGGGRRKWIFSVQERDQVPIPLRVLNSLMGRGNCAPVLIKSILFRAFHARTFSGNVSNAFEMRSFYSQKNSPAYIFLYAAD
jgi:hypothetical protein